MNKRYIITKTEIRQKNFQVFAEYLENNRLMSVTCEVADTQNILGNIYIGRVKDIVKNLNAAFIDIGNHISCYYALEDYKSPLFTHKTGKKQLCAGDELVVQVIKEASKTKFPVVTTNLNFTGRYVILTTENHQLGISAKLTKSQKIFFQEHFTGEDLSNYGLIIRTNAVNVNLETVMDEYEKLKQEYFSFTQTYIGKTVFSCLKKAEPFYMKDLKARILDETDQIITDDPVVLDELKTCFSVIPRAADTFLIPQNGCSLRLYEDTSYPLARLYPVASGIMEALNERVWLKSGAYLIISPTEALTVIDVNSGKNRSSKNKQENILKINKEAAIEIARQLRLRNISGICIVDFINMKTTDEMESLLHVFRAALKEDSIATQLIDITKLGLVELTRKKEKKPLLEQFLYEK